MRAHSSVGSIALVLLSTAAWSQKKGDFVDLSSGGNFDGFIAVADRVLAMADDKTKIIPGHGVVSDKAGLKAWRDMLATIRDRVKKLADAGKTLDDVKAAKVTSEWDDKWGKEFIKPDQVVELVYTALKPAKQ